MCDVGAFERTPCAVDADCDDGDPCTADSCDPSDGSCIHTSIAGPPVIIDFDFSPKIFDLANGPPEVTCSIAATDCETFVKDAFCTFENSSGASGTASCLSSAPSAGDASNGIWTCTFTTSGTISNVGLWTVRSMGARDSQLRLTLLSTPQIEAAGFPTQFEVISSDIDPPILTGFDFNPKQVDVSTQSQDVTCSVTATDSGVGIRIVSCRFVSPTGQIGYCSSETPVSGDRFDGEWSCTVTIPASSELGAWSVEYVNVRDELYNPGHYETADLQALGFPTQLDVISQ